LLLLPGAGAAQSPRLSDERVVLHTVAGDVVIALFPDAAPQHVAQILKLVRLGCYDHTNFTRVEPGFVLQLAGVEQRHPDFPLSPTQTQAIHPIKAEFSKTLKHRRGTVSMARMDGLPDSASTSFSIILGDAPHLDGNYTIFGEVVHGMDAVDQLVLVPPRFFDVRMPPTSIVPLDVTRAEVISNANLDPTRIVPAHAVPIPPEVIFAAHREAWEQYRSGGSQGATFPGGTEETAFGFDRTYLVAGGLLLVMLLSLASFVGAGRLTLRWIVSLNMLTVLIGGFLLLALLTPYAQQDPTKAIGVLMFVAVCGIFKLLSRFESIG
jgi:cyclophilin family peptidyl-prolyl cis-trans isomerase